MSDDADYIKDNSDSYDAGTNSLVHTDVKMIEVFFNKLNSLDYFIN